MSTPPIVPFGEEHARRYDEQNSALAPISGNLHFLTRLVLEDLPERSRVLSVGAGTGADILALARAFPSWSFVAVEPSSSMLEVCRERLDEAGVLHRCELVHGFAHDLAEQADFDAATVFLVAHFVEREQRRGFFESIVGRLRSGGTLVNAEVSVDLDSEAFPAMLRNWQAVQRLRGASAEMLEKTSQMLRDQLTVLSPEDTESVLREAGVAVPVRFFQSFMIAGWYGTKG